MGQRATHLPHLEAFYVTPVLLSVQRRKSKVSMRVRTIEKVVLCCEAEHNERVQALDAKSED